MGRYDDVGSGSGPFQVLAAEAACIAGTPVATINLVKSTSQRTLAAVGSEVTLLDRRDSMCGVIIDAAVPVHVRDASRDPRWSGHPFVDGRLGRVRFYASQPLLTPSGLALGTLCVLDEEPHELEPWQVDELERVARKVVDALEGARLAHLKQGVRSTDWAGVAPSASRLPHAPTPEHRVVQLVYKRPDLRWGWNLRVGPDVIAAHVGHGFETQAAAVDMADAVITGEYGDALRRVRSTPSDGERQPVG